VVDVLVGESCTKIVQVSDESSAAGEPRVRAGPEPGSDTPNQMATSTATHPNTLRALACSSALGFQAT